MFACHKKRSGLAMPYVVVFCMFNDLWLFVLFRLVKLLTITVNTSFYNSWKFTSRISVIVKTMKTTNKFYNNKSDKYVTVGWDWEFMLLLLEVQKCKEGDRRCVVNVWKGLPIISLGNHRTHINLTYRVSQPTLTIHTINCVIC